MLLDLFGDAGQIPQVELLDDRRRPPLREEPIEVHRDDGVVGTVPVDDGEGDDRGVVAVEVPLDLALEVEALYVFVVLDEDELLADQSAVGEEVVVLLEGLDGHHLLLSQVVVLELLDLVLPVLHPQDPAPVEVKRHCHLRHPELPVQLDLVPVRVDLVHVLVLDLQLNGWVGAELHRAYRFWVGNAQKITILMPCIMVMEWEQTMLE